MSSSPKISCHVIIPKLYYHIMIPKLYYHIMTSYSILNKPSYCKTHLKPDSKCSQIFQLCLPTLRDATKILAREFSPIQDREKLGYFIHKLFYQYFQGYRT
jgi:hypothetical protein